MSDTDVLLRVVAFAMIAASLLVARFLSGARISNVPLWNGLGMLALYACYCFSGMRFGNGSSIEVELIVALLIAASVGAFAIGERLPASHTPASGGARQRAQKERDIRVPPITASYLRLQALVSAAFYLMLTDGQPWRLLTDPVGLKFERLQGLADKSPLLLNFDAIVLALSLVGLAWAIVGHCDTRRSRFSLGLSLGLMLLYVLSTGSRTPLIAVLLQAVAAVSVARLRSHDMAWMARKTWLLVLATVAGVGLMVFATGSRIEFEDLSDDVFGFYFNIDDFGLVGPLLRSGEAASFFFATAVTYAASTYNNIVIRYQELAAITPTMGYRFLFFYISAAQILLPGLLPRAASDWRDLAQTNNDHLGDISQAAGQWTTPYGDLLWDFGIAGTVFFVMLVGILTGVLVSLARRRPTFLNVLLQVFVVGFSLSPLVNPFLSLYVHYGLAVALIIGLAHAPRRQSASRRRLVGRTNGPLPTPGST